MPRAFVTTLEQRLSALRNKKSQARPIGARYDRALAKVKRLRTAMESAAEEVTKPQKSHARCVGQACGLCCRSKRGPAGAPQSGLREGTKRGVESADDTVHRPRRNDASGHAPLSTASRRLSPRTHTFRWQRTCERWLEDLERSSNALLLTIKVEISETEWAFERTREAFEKVAKEETENGGVTLSYIFLHCNSFPLEDFFWWVSAGKMDALQLVVRNLWRKL